MSKKKIKTKNQNRVLRAWTEISDETGVHLHMVGQIHKSVTKKRKEGIQTSSKNACNLIIQDLINNDKGLIKDILANNGINSSEDFGIVIKSLCDKGLLIKEEADNYDDFKGHFTLDTIEQFIKNNKLKKEMDWFKTFSDFLYYFGITIILLSYFTRISNKIGWLGLGITMLGWFLLKYRKKIEPTEKVF